MLGVAVLLLILELQSAVGNPSWTSRMFPVHQMTDDLIRFPPDNGCTFFLSQRQYFAVGDQCSGIPSIHPLVGHTLNVKATGIETLWEKSLIDWDHLLSLNIDMNSELRVIQPRIFSSMKSLANLSISNNYRLRPLHPDVFYGLIHLRELRFVKNKLLSLRSFINSLRPQILPSLRHLDLSDNPIEVITARDFQAMVGSMLETLTLNMCGILTIQPDALSQFSNLKSLKLSNNNLSPEVLINLIKNINRTTRNFEDISLASNLIHKRPTNLLRIIGKTSIKKLDLKENHFDSLSLGFFPMMPNLEVLDLSGLMAYNLEKGTFSVRALPRLSHLVFSRNRIPGFIPGLHVRNLVELDLSENSCEHCTKASYFKLNDYDFTEMISLQVLDLSKNNIYQVRRHAFVGLSTLQALILSNCSLFVLETFSFLDLINLEHLDLSQNRFHNATQLVHQTFEGLGNLTSLRLDGCFINSLPNSNIFLPLKSLKYLTLRKNYLVNFDPVVFSPLVHLHQLDLSENRLTPWTSRLFSNNSHLDTVSFFSNHLGEINPIMIQDFIRLNEFDLRENPIFCDCNLIHSFLGFQDSLQKSLKLNTKRVKCFAPAYWTGVYLIDFLNFNFNNIKCLSWTSIMLFLLVIIIPFVFIAALLVYYLRWYIRYWIFLFRQSWRSNFPGKKILHLDGKYKYDAFVSYSHEDRSFVIRLVAMLEKFEPHFRLCVFERDFQIGDIITESVLECLSVSRRTIFILSDSFAKSQWCQWELQMAYNKKIFFNPSAPDALIIVKLGEITDAHMTPILRYLVKSRVYLQWHSDPKRQRIFWEKLRSELKVTQSS